MAVCLVLRLLPSAWETAEPPRWLLPVLGCSATSHWEGSAGAASHLQDTHYTLGHVIIFTHNLVALEPIILWCDGESESEVVQSCPTLCDPMDYGPPGSSIHGIFQARIPEWIAIPFSTIYRVIELDIIQVTEHTHMHARFFLRGKRQEYTVEGRPSPSFPESKLCVRFPIIKGSTPSLSFSFLHSKDEGPPHTNSFADNDGHDCLQVEKV